MIPERIISLKWELNREVDLLNNKNPHMAACAVWNVVDDLLVTLVNERGSNNEHLKKLQNFLREEWQ